MTLKKQFQDTLVSPILFRNHSDIELLSLLSESSKQSYREEVKKNPILRSNVFSLISYLYLRNYLRQIEASNPKKAFSKEVAQFVTYLHNLPDEPALRR